MNNWKFLTPSLITARRAALVAMLLFGLGMIFVWTVPGRPEYAPLGSSSLRAVFRPYRGMMISFLVWCALSDPVVAAISKIGPFMLANWRRRTLLALLVAELFLFTRFWINYPYHVVRMCELTTCDRTEPTVLLDWHTHRNMECFAGECCQDFPESARILYHGHIEGMVFAYQVYPRRVFMLPEEYGEISRSWHAQKWLNGMPDDPLEAFWHANPPPTIDRDTFIREHGLTHEVWFNGDEPVACRWRKLE